MYSADDLTGMAAKAVLMSLVAKTKLLTSDQGAVSLPLGVTLVLLVNSLTSQAFLVPIPEDQGPSLHSPLCSKDI